MEVTGLIPQRIAAGVGSHRASQSGRDWCSKTRGAETKIVKFRAVAAPMYFAANSDSISVSRTSF